MKKEKIIIQCKGAIGDTVVALPAIWAVRENFPDADLYLLSHEGTKGNLSREVLENSKLFKEVLVYKSIHGSSRFLQGLRLLKMVYGLRKYRFDALAYLVLATTKPSEVKRDKFLYRLAGIKRFIGMDGFVPVSVKNNGAPLPEMPPQADLILERLRVSGLAVPAAGQGRMDLKLQPNEKTEFAAKLSKLTSDGGRKWIGVSPGTNFASNKWAPERYQEVVSRLIAEFDIWPVVFGGEAEKLLGDQFIKVWGRGYNLAGQLSVRETAVGLERCALCLGNDTGAMHLAAAVQTYCVSIFSSRQMAGLWYPYTQRKKVFRAKVECEGCELGECVVEKMKCILSFGVDEVFQACEDILKRVN